MDKVKLAALNAAVQLGFFSNIDGMVAERMIGRARVFEAYLREGQPNWEKITVPYSHVEMGGPTWRYRGADAPIRDNIDRMTKPEPKRTGLTFAEAVEAMGEGKRVRRAKWSNDRYWYNARGAIHQNTSTFGTPTVFLLDVVATDWEIVE